MARPFSATDAKRVIQRHQNIIKQLNIAVPFADKYRDQVEEASDVLVAQEVLKVLDDIPIEEINRDKRGIRVKALRRLWLKKRLTVLMPNTAIRMTQKTNGEMRLRRLCDEQFR